MAEKLVCIKTFENRKDAKVAQGLLEQYEINSCVQAEDSGRKRPSHPAVGSEARLMVEEEKSKRAKKVPEV